MSKLAVLAVASFLLGACTSGITGIECVATTDCGSNAACVAGICSTVCIDRYSCATGETCELGYCVPCGAACEENGSDGGGAGDTNLIAGDTAGDNAGDNYTAPSDSDSPGDTTNGDTTNGDTTNGDTTNGDTTNGDTNAGDSRPPGDIGGCGLTFYDCGGVCIPLADCCATETLEVTCDDNVDNDCDGLTDCDDTVDCPDTTSCGQSGQECQGSVCVCTIPGPETICDDGLDDDCDGPIDCDDSDCDASTCAPRDCDPPTACAGFADTCDETGTLDVTCTDYLCSSGVCTPSSPVTTPQSCGRITGGTSCGTTSCGGWGLCSFSGSCGNTGTQSRTCTDRICSGGTCNDFDRTESQNCSRDTNGMSCDDGLFCTQTDTCSGGSCFGTGDPCPGADGDGDCSETCDDTTNSCAGNDPLGTPCGGSAADCDASDTCDGSGGCTDNVDPAGTVCQGAGASPFCDPADTCNGSAKSCPVNNAPDNTSCNSGTTCGGLCLSGSCNAIAETTTRFYADCWECAGFDDAGGGAGNSRLEAAYFSGYDWSCVYEEEPSESRGMMAFDTGTTIPNNVPIIWARVRAYGGGGPGSADVELYEVSYSGGGLAGTWYLPQGTFAGFFPAAPDFVWTPWIDVTASSVNTTGWTSFALYWPVSEWETCGWSGRRYQTSPGGSLPPELSVRYCSQ